MEDLPLVKVDLSREHLAKINSHTSESPKEEQLHVLRELAEAIADNSLLSLKGLGEWERSLKTGGQPASHQPSERARRTM